MVGDIEYLVKKVEALETLYQAEKERAQSIAANYARLDSSLNELRNVVQRLARYFREVPM